MGHEFAPTVPITPEARKALVVRDGECVWPGCDRPIGWCETHHLEPWRRGGVSDLGQMVSLCTRHHARADDGWSVIKNEWGDWMVVRPHPFWDGAETGSP